MIKYETPEEDLPEIFAFITLTKGGVTPNIRFGVTCSACDAIVSGESKQFFDDRLWDIAEFHNQLHNFEPSKPEVIFKPEKQ